MLGKINSKMNVTTIIQKYDRVKNFCLLTLFSIGNKVEKFAFSVLSVK